MEDLKDQFFKAAGVFSKMIIAEKHLEVKEKKVCPVDVGGVAGGTKFSVHGLFFKYPVDTKQGNSWLYGGATENNLYAAKASNHDLRGLSYFMLSDTTKEFQIPMSALIDYQGYRLVVMTTLPLVGDTLVYGSCDAGKSMKWEESIHNKLEKMAKSLNLRPHLGPHDTVMALCGDLEIHKFTLDDKPVYYGLDMARIFPPADPQPGSPYGSIFFRMLRPELIKMFSTPLSSDAFSKWQSSDPLATEMNADVTSIMKLLQKQINQFALHLSHNKEVNNKFILPDVQLTKRPLFNGVATVDSFSRELHTKGINLRYLGSILIKMEGNDEMQCYIASLLIIRALKNLWKLKIQEQSQKTKERVYKICLDITIPFLNSCLNLRNERKTEFSKSLRTTILSMFSAGLLIAEEEKLLLKKLKELKTKLLIPWITVRFCQLCGISLNSSTVDIINSPKGHNLTISRADITDFVPNLKCLPIMEYYSGLYWYFQAQQCKEISTKQVLYQNSISRLGIAINYPFHNAKYYYASALLNLKMINPNLFYDPELVVEILRTVTIDELKNNPDGKFVICYYIDYLCALMWKIFTSEGDCSQNEKKHALEELAEVRKLREKKIYNPEVKSLLLYLNQEQKNSFLGYPNSKEKDFIHNSIRNKKLLSKPDTTGLPTHEAVAMNLESEVLSIATQKKNYLSSLYSTRSDLLISFLQEAMNWDLDKERKQWLFNSLFSFSKIINIWIESSPDIDLKKLCELFTDDPLSFLLCRSDLDSYKYLNKHYNHILDKNGKTLLHLIAEKPIYNIKEMKFLLSLNANLEVKDENGYTPLCSACTSTFVQKVKILLDEKANINIHTKDGTPLMIAAAHNNTELVQLFLNMGASVNDICSSETVLHKLAKIGHEKMVEHLVSLNADLSIKNKEGNTPFMVAVKNGKEKLVPHLFNDPNEIKPALEEATRINNIPVVMQMISSNANLNQYGGNILIIACQMGHTKMVEMLIAHMQQAGINIDLSVPLLTAMQNGYANLVEILSGFGATSNENPAHLLENACKNGHLSIVELLFNYQMVGQDLSKPLSNACGAGRKDIVEYLIKKKANLDSNENYRESPLYIASKRGYFDVVKLLLDAKANPNANGTSSLSVAVYKGHKSVVDLLVQEGANIHFQGTTILHTAADTSYPYLLEVAQFGVDLELLDSEGYTPLARAIYSKNDKGVMQLLEFGSNVNTPFRKTTHLLLALSNQNSPEIITALLDKNADIDGPQPTTPLQLACLNSGYIEIIKTILSKEKATEEYVNRKNNLGHTALHHAAHSGCLDYVQRLILCKADVNAKGNDDETPLHFACKGGYFSIAEYLIGEGVDINAVTKSNVTPLQAALEKGNRKLIDLLLSKLQQTNPLDIEVEGSGAPFFVSGLWKGYWLQNSSKGDMTILLDIYKGSISGYGSDSVGTFSWQGFCFENTGQIRMTKTYHGQHKVIYEGTKEGSVIKGTWVINENCYGEFVLEKWNED
eukprot:TRINITY_DN6876_c0_g1_i1.p1 TRINITY_DN6876_c0_g1~~TRINITY_DN6876_c0_g1_i1.p1  ORF type:complete len:1561 (-),score=403.22 TRINITY_DN6876_c0_g1_i1:65-4528(-)